MSTIRADIGSMTPTAADILGPGEVIEAQDAGRRAALDGAPVTAHPWGTADDAKARARRQMWAAGYAQGITDRYRAAGWTGPHTDASPPNESGGVDPEDAAPVPPQNASGDQPEPGRETSSPVPPTPSPDTPAGAVLGDRAMVKPPTTLPEPAASDPGEGSGRDLSAPPPGE
ncbi:hypothetical protein [Actinokineospora terrae]|uniref:Uncharacterized protein n=1 Tax=Actinokineospora terrae TaxID=155974 RepID=A0A1H9M7P6_9PSEU|nr:hypothetical protein [Actinokineospora terrae]SER19770.1 hypothetical protein SAMN04487818_1029 [Actinokineospora terrae]